MKGRQSWLSEEMGWPLAPGRLEEEGYSRGYKCVAGLDEVGRGPLAGPVVAAAVVLPRAFLVSGLGLGDHSSLDPLIKPQSTLTKVRRVKTPDSNLAIKDSKLLDSAERERLSTWIQENAVSWGLGVVSPEEIDRLNILKASLLAMAQALKGLKPVPDCLLIDGQHKIPVEFLQATADGLKKGEGNPAILGSPSQRAIKKGDQLCLSIAAASIVAKVARDRMMADFDKLYPEYGFAKHKGYSSPVHLAALSRHGPSPIHRASFRPVRECLSPVVGAVPGSLFSK